MVCHSNQLTSLPELPVSLHELHCYNNQLTSLPIQLNNMNTCVLCDGVKYDLIKEGAVKMIIPFYRRRQSVNCVVRQSRLYHDELYLRGHSRARASFPPKIEMIK